MSYPYSTTQTTTVTNQAAALDYLHHYLTRRFSTGDWISYEAMKRAVEHWREARLARGLSCPSYEACVRVVAEIAGV